MNKFRAVNGLFFILLWVACAETNQQRVVPGDSSVQHTTRRTLSTHKSTFTEEQLTVFGEESVSRPTQESEQAVSPPASEFPDGQHIVLKLGETYPVVPCRNIDVSINQILVTGGDLGTVATIVCRDRKGATKKAEFSCPGTQLDFKYDSSPYTLICQ